MESVSDKSKVEEVEEVVYEDKKSLEIKEVDAALNNYRLALIKARDYGLRMIDGELFRYREQKIKGLSDKYVIIVGMEGVGKIILPVGNKKIEDILLKLKKDGKIRHMSTLIEVIK